MENQKHPRIWQPTNDNDEEEETAVEAAPKQNQSSSRDWIIFLVLVLIALVARLIFLFVFQNPQDAYPGWYEDAYHHWQIAYLSYERGFKESFLRLWDLKGMEYFWGLLHPLILGGLMKLFASPSIVIARILSLTTGSVSIGFIYLLTKRYFGIHAGLAAAILAMGNPVALFSDTSGMQEPLGIMLLLWSLYLWPQRAFISGLVLMLAGMVRAEFWVLGMGVLFLMLVGKEKTDHKIAAAVSYGLIAFLYMKYLLDKTGNAIYPIYWNYMGNAVGEWQAAISPTPQMLAVKNVYIAILAAGVVFLGLLLWRRPKYLPFFGVGAGIWVILAYTIGLTEYLLSYLSRFWVDRIMLLPYIFVAVWFSVLVFKLFGRKYLAVLGWALILGVLAASQFLWQPIEYWKTYTKGNFDKMKVLAQEIGKHYRGGGLLIFEDRPLLTYELVYFQKVKGADIVGQMFDPYFYIDSEPYLNWGENREIVLDWLKKENIKTIVFTGNRERYRQLVEKEPDWFTQQAYLKDWDTYIYSVN